jgi:hypothetical protein
MAEADLPLNLSMARLNLDEVLNGMSWSCDRIHFATTKDFDDECVMIRKHINADMKYLIEETMVLIKQQADVPEMTVLDHLQAINKLIN